MDHETALQAANQALGGNAPRSTSRFASVELRDMGGAGEPARAALPLDARRAVPNGAWEFAAMVSVGLATLLLVLAVWFL